MGRIGYFSKSEKPLGRPCRECGKTVERLPDGRMYEEDGKFHNQQNGRCQPSVEWQNQEKLRRANWEAKNLINGEDKREFRSTTPMYLRNRK